jgi:aminopeptidase N
MKLLKYFFGKRLILSIPVLFIVWSGAAQSKIDVLHYKFSIEVNDKNDTIYGQAEIKVKFFEPTSVLKLDLVTQNENGRGMKVDMITGPGVRGFMKKPDSLRIFISSSAPIAANDTATFIVTYHGIPADGLIISKNKYGNRTFFADNWPNRAHHWIPCVDDPADKASVEFIVTAPDHYRIISNGILMEESNLPSNLPTGQAGKKLTHWKEDVPVPTKVMVIGAADFAVSNAGSVDCIPVTSWLFPENKEKGFYDYAIAKDILSFFINYIGPYPYKKLANVQSKTIFGGMENASAIFYSESSVTGMRQHESLIAHEIVHQWFGNTATEKNFSHLWLSEGFATYLAHIYNESKYGTEKFINGMKADRDAIIEYGKSSRKPVVDTETPTMQLLNINSYEKGSWILHMLRRELGDTVFKNTIRKYYENYSGKNADTKDLQKVFENVSGKDLNQFFKQWLFTAENPKLKISWKNLPKEKKVAVTIEQLQNTLFEIPLDLFLITRIRGNTSSKIMISKKIETFYFPLNGPLLSLHVDPKISLLAEIIMSEEK